MEKLIIGNWKCNPKTFQEAKTILDSVKKGLKSLNKETEAVVCPPFVFLSKLDFKGSYLKMGGQNCFYEEKGAFTGEISPAMLKDLGCEYVLLGHSERRKYFSETDEMINKKIKAILNLKMKPVLCIGETEEEKQKGETENVLKIQLEKGLAGVSGDYVDFLTIAYEPVWAIGTSNPCSSEDAKKTAGFVKSFLSGFFGASDHLRIKVLYGGSVNSENAQSFLKEGGIEGLLIGGVSLLPDEFVKIVNS